MVIVIKDKMCKTKRSFWMRSYAWSLQWIHEDGAKRNSPIMEYGGVFEEVFIKRVRARAIKKDDPLEEIKIVII